MLNKVIPNKRFAYFKLQYEQFVVFLLNEKVFKRKNHILVK